MRMLNIRKEFLSFRVFLTMRYYSAIIEIHITVKFKEGIYLCKNILRRKKQLLKSTIDIFYLIILQFFLQLRIFSNGI